MSDHSRAALERICAFAETIVYEADGIDEELKSAASAILLDAARLFARVANDFAERK